MEWVISGITLLLGYLLLSSHRLKKLFPNKRILVVVLLTLSGLKLLYDKNGILLDTNYYGKLSVKRNVNKKELKEAFVKFSLKNHPDKIKTNDPDATDNFNHVKNIYDVLNNDNHKDIYNRFGLQTTTELKFDPRDDPVRLSSSIGIKHLFWGIVLYFFTISEKAQESKAFIFSLWLFTLIYELLVSFTSMTLPHPLYIMGFTEYEVLSTLQQVLPILSVFFRYFFESSYTDIAGETDNKITELYLLDKQCQQELVDIQYLLAGVNNNNNFNSRSSGDGGALKDAQSRIDKLMENIDSFNQKGESVKMMLQQNRTRSQYRYHWLLFVIAIIFVIIVNNFASELLSAEIVIEGGDDKGEGAGEL